MRKQNILKLIFFWFIAGFLFFCQVRPALADWGFDPDNGPLIDGTNPDYSFQIKDGTNIVCDTASESDAIPNCHGLDAATVLDKNKDGQITLVGRIKDDGGVYDQHLHDVVRTWVIFDNNSSYTSSYYKIKYSDNNNGTYTIAEDTGGTYNDQLSIVGGGTKTSANQTDSYAEFNSSNSIITINVVLNVQGISNSGAFLSNIYLKAMDERGYYCSSEWNGIDPKPESLDCTDYGSEPFFMGHATDRILMVGGGDFSTSDDACVVDSNANKALDVWNGNYIRTNLSAQKSGSYSIDPFSVGISRFDGSSEILNILQLGSTIYLPIGQSTFKNNSLGYYVSAVDLANFRGGTTIKINANSEATGSCSDYQAEMELQKSDGAVLQTWTVPTTAANYTYNFTYAFALKNLKIVLKNDCWRGSGNDGNLIINTLKMYSGSDSYTGLPVSKTLTSTGQSYVFGTDGKQETTSGVLTEILGEGGARLFDKDSCLSSNNGTINYTEEVPVFDSVTLGTGDGDTVCTDLNCGSYSWDTIKNWGTSIDTNHNGIVSGSVVIYDLDTYPKKDGNPGINNKITDIKTLTLKIIDNNNNTRGLASYSVDDSGNVSFSETDLLKITSVSPSNKTSAISNGNLTINFRVDYSTFTACDYINARYFEVVATDYAGHSNSIKNVFSYYRIVKDEVCPLFKIAPCSGSDTVPDGSSLNIEFSWPNGAPNPTTTIIPIPKEAGGYGEIQPEEYVNMKSKTSGYYVCGSDFTKYDGVYEIIGENVRSGTHVNILKTDYTDSRTVTIYYENNAPTVKTYIMKSYPEECEGSACNDKDLILDLDPGLDRTVPVTVEVNDEQTFPVRDGNPSITNKFTDLKAVNIKALDNTGAVIDQCSFSDTGSSRSLTTTSGGTGLITSCTRSPSGNTATSDTLTFYLNLDLKELTTCQAFSGSLVVEATDFSNTTTTQTISGLKYWNGKDICAKFYPDLTAVTSTDLQSSASTFYSKFYLPESCSYDDPAILTDSVGRYIPVIARTNNPETVHLPYRHYGGADECNNLQITNNSGSSGFYVLGTDWQDYGGARHTDDGKDGIDENYLLHPNYTSIYYHSNIALEDAVPQVTTVELGTGNGDTRCSGSDCIYKDLINDLDTNHNQMVSGTVVVTDAQSTPVRNSYPVPANKESDLYNIQVSLGSGNSCIYTDDPESSTSPTVANAGLFTDCSYRVSGTAVAINFKIDVSSMEGCADFSASLAVTAKDFAERTANVSTYYGNIVGIDVWNGKDVCAKGAFVDLDQSFYAADSFCEAIASREPSVNYIELQGNAYSNQLRLNATYSSGSSLWTSSIPWYLSSHPATKQPYFYFTIPETGDTSITATYEIDSSQNSPYFIDELVNLAYGDGANLCGVGNLGKVTTNLVYGGTYPGSYVYDPVLGRMSAQYDPLFANGMVFGVRQMVRAWLQEKDSSIFTNAAASIQIPFKTCPSCLISLQDLNNNGLVISNGSLGTGVVNTYGNIEVGSPNNTYAYASPNSPMPDALLPSYEELKKRVNSPEEITPESGTLLLSSLKEGENLPTNKVYFVNGNLTIDMDNTVDNNNYLVFVVKNSITVAENVHHSAGIFIAKNITIEDNGVANYDEEDISDQITIEGSLIFSEALSVNRTMGVGNNKNPPLIVNYRSDMLYSMLNNRVTLLTSKKRFLGEE